MWIELAAQMMRRTGSALLTLLMLSAPAVCAEVLRVGKAVPEAFSFVPLDIGMRYGFFKKYGIEIEPSAYSSGGMLTQALTAGSVDIGLGSSPEMAGIVKGVPVKAVAAMAGRPLLIGLMVRSDGPIKTVDDLKGHRIGVTSANSLTAWLVAELSLHKGWGRDGIAVTPLGAIPGLLAAMMMMQVDGFVADYSSLLRAEEAGEGKILFSFGDLVQDFHIHVIFATDKLIATRPAAIRGFLAGWFETIAFMRANKAKTVETAMAVLDISQGVAERTYDTLMPMFSDDGRFNLKALATVSRSYVDLKYLPAEPDMSKLYTEEFLPKSR
ncbi:MAG TPA: ABC transporter substrate-binding protein [Xanthobacteraceae bacterium]|nr:ABC transporter substrate-binding protein [Xanthobacteraceae bacterium]